MDSRGLPDPPTTAQLALEDSAWPEQARLAAILDEVGPTALQWFDGRALLVRRGPGARGRSLVGRLGPDCRVRLATLCWGEAQAEQATQALDHGIMLGYCFQLLEAGLRAVLRGLAQRALPWLGHATDGHPYLHERLAAWPADHQHTGLGHFQLLLASLRVTAAEGHPDAGPALDACFRPEFAALLATAGPERALARLREGYRNPVQHGRLLAARSDYEAVATLVFGTTSANRWDLLGPDRGGPAPDEGVLHHHLVSWYP